jgi:hypothetical protein
MEEGKIELGKFVGIQILRTAKYIGFIAREFIAKRTFTFLIVNIFEGKHQKYESQMSTCIVE